MISIRHFIALLAAFCALNAFAAVDVNTASQAELESVKGIGPGLSGKITDARQTGNFKNWDDLVDRVGGIGPGNAARFSQAGLTVSGSAFDGNTAAAKPSKSARTARAGKTEKSEKTTKAPSAAKARPSTTM